MPAYMANYGIIYVHQVRFYIAIKDQQRVNT